MSSHHPQQKLFFFFSRKLLPTDLFHCIKYLAKYLAKTKSSIELTIALKTHKNEVLYIVFNQFKSTELAFQEVFFFFNRSKL